MHETHHFFENSMRLMHIAKEHRKGLEKASNSLGLKRGFQAFGAQSLGNQESKLKCLTGVQPRIAMGVVATE